MGNVIELSLLKDEERAKKLRKFISDCKTNEVAENAFRECLENGIDFAEYARENGGELPQKYVEIIERLKREMNWKKPE